MALLPLPGPTVGLATNTNTPTTTYYSWFRSLFDVLKAIVAAVADILALFPAGTSGEWTDYTPTVTANAGTFTTVSATGSYFQIGKVVSVRFRVVITTIGTATGGTVVTLPVTAVAQDQTLSGTVIAGAALGSTVSVIIASAELKARCRLYDASTATLTASGVTFVCAGTYEAA